MKCFARCSWIKVLFAFVICMCLFMFMRWNTAKDGTSGRMNFTLNQGSGYLNLLPPRPSLLTAHKSVQNVYDGQDLQYDLRILVIVYNRAQSMRRLLDSINKAEFYNDHIKLEVWIDRSMDGNIDTLTLEGAKDFEFQHGDYEVKPHPKHVGIFGQWLTTWKVRRNSSEIVVILEDDLTVSPFFYKYLKLVHQKYEKEPRINGFSLQGISVVHGSAGGWLKAPEDSHVFLYPVLGTWGFSPSTKNWADFIDWFNVFYKDKNFEPLVPGNIATDWYKQLKQMGKIGGMWSIWHIYYAWKHDEYTLYPNFKGLDLVN